jgi:cytochrome c biogenesis protein
VLLPLQFHNFDKMRGGKFVLAVESEGAPTAQASAPAEVRYYTGLQVTKDPGVWVVYSGFILMILGCIVTFFMSHQQVLVTITPKGDKNRLEIAGVATKNKLAIQKKVEQLAGRLKKA